MIDNIRNYWDHVQYNLFIKKRHKKLHEENVRLRNESNVMEKDNKDLRFKINVPNYDKDTSIRLQVIEKNILKFNDMISSLINKPEGYILYLGKGNKGIFYSIKKLKYLKDFNKELYNIHEKIGTYKNKPLFLVKYGYAISLTVDKKLHNLMYDPIAYYNYVNIATKGNLTQIGEKMDMWLFIQKNLLLIIIVIAIFIALFTPEGQQFINNILPK